MLLHKSRNNAKNYQSRNTVYHAHIIWKNAVIVEVRAYSQAERARFVWIAGKALAVADMDGDNIIQ